jgi:hypothetical protein
LEAADMELASAEVRKLLLEWLAAGWLNSLPVKKVK